jgi:hypothetical protein
MNEFFTPRMKRCESWQATLPHVDSETEDRYNLHSSIDHRGIDSTRIPPGSQAPGLETPGLEAPASFLDLHHGKLVLIA